jgi:hypothetical protein
MQVFQTVFEREKTPDSTYQTFLFLGRSVI